MAWTGATRRRPHSVIGKIIFKTSDGTLEKSTAAYLRLVVGAVALGV
jgi:hypothetical protein